MNQDVEENYQNTFIWNVSSGRRRRRRRGSWRRHVVGEEAAGEEEGEVAGGGGCARRDRWRRCKEAVGVAVQVGDEAPHRAGGREGGRKKEGADLGGLVCLRRNGV
jgi:hypothetical protein